MKSIVITVSLQGETHVETQGFTGPSCREASQFLEQALGEKASEQRTAEFYQEMPTHHTEHTHS